MTDIERDHRWEKMWANVGSGVSQESGRPYFYANIYLKKKLVPFVGVVEFIEDPIDLFYYIRTIYPVQVLTDITVFREFWDHMVECADELLDIFEKGGYLW